MILRHQLLWLGVASLLCSLAALSGVDADVGVNYGTVGSNLPTPIEVVALLKTTTITRVKLYNADPAILTAFAGSGFALVVGVTNDQIFSLARSPAYAQQWISTNIASYVPSTNITAIAVGNQVLTESPTMASSLLPAMQNLHTGLVNLGLSDKIKVSTPHSFAILTKSYPPDQGVFRADLADGIFSPMLDFFAQTGAPFMINAYPYFAYREDPDHLLIGFTLFEPTAGLTDPATGLHYDNMFDAQVDAVYAAMSKLGHEDVTVVVSETGWPSAGDPGEVGTGISNAQTYNSNLLKHLAAGTGTPRRPGAPVETYVFSLFNENKKPGPESERNFGLFQPDRSSVYNVGIQSGNDTSSPPVWSPPPAPAGNWSAPPPPAPTGNWTAPPTPAPIGNGTAPPPPAANSTVPPPAPAGNGTAPPPRRPTPPPASSPPPSPIVFPPPPPSPPSPPSPPPSPSPPPPFSIPPPPPFTAPPSPPPTPPKAPNPSPLPVPTPETPPAPLAPLAPPAQAPPAPVAPAAPPAQAPPGPPDTSPGAPPKQTWCVAKPGSEVADLANALDFACGEGGADCSAIQSGGPCYLPDTLFSHASYAFDSYYSKNGRNTWNCYFNGSALITITNPSYDGCVFP
ncbi:hypothetical protein R1sor_019369 [Riccia sorocarpa]|uniref:glucan endo-1,3-beta-D-glucosidase n=1 Tax=Riccia sorocarpa TaxID=122646 RepID=A0ABD3IF17_9MARC